MVFIIIVLSICWIAMTFATMFVTAFTFEDLYDAAFSDGVILMSFLLWYILLPCCAAVWLIRLIAYPFRKCWW